MNNPLLAEIVAAYQTHNFKPLRRMFCFHEKGVDHVCPLVCLAVQRGVVDRADPSIEIDGGANAALEWSAKTFGEEFTIGLLDGWDGQEMAKNTLDYIEGHGLGVEAAKQLSPHDPAV